MLSREKLLNKVQRDILIRLGLKQLTMETAVEATAVPDAIITAEPEAAPEAEEAVGPGAKKTRKKKDMNAPVMARDCIPSQ